MGDKKLYIGYFLKKLLGKPLTVTIHAHELYQRSNYDHPERIQELLESCDKIITISDFNKNILVEDFHVPEDKITVMRLFPEPSRIEKVFGKKKILTVANWVEKKGYRVIIEAVKKMDRDDFIWLIVGGPTFSENSIDLDEYVRKSRLENRVFLLGQFGKELLDVVFSSCDIFCLPSITERYADGKPAEREGIPVAIMEAMAWGKPVISTLHAGIPELIEEILVEENDVEGLIQAVEHLLDHPDERKELGKKNRETIQLKYKKDNVQLLSDIFDDFSGK
jgi:glycosyltransferase involved in cell wall biosynthesis